MSLGQNRSRRPEPSETWRRAHRTHESRTATSAESSEECSLGKNLLESKRFTGSKSTLGHQTNIVTDLERQSRAQNHLNSEFHTLQWRDYPKKSEDS